MLTPVSSTSSPTLFVHVKKALPVVLLIVSVVAAVFALYRLWSNWSGTSSQHDAGGAAGAHVPPPSSAAPPVTAPVFEAKLLNGLTLHGAQIWTANICGVKVSIQPWNNREGHFNGQAAPSSTDSAAYLAHLRKSRGSEVTLHLKLDDSMFNHEGCLDTGVNAFLAARSYIAERQRTDNSLTHIRIFWLIGRGNGFPIEAHLFEFRRRLDLAFKPVA